MSFAFWNLHWGRRAGFRVWMWGVSCFLMAGLTACTASLPLLVPDLKLRHAPPIQLEGARGPLTAAQSKAVLDRLRSRSPDTDIFTRHLALEEAIVGSPLTVGNRVQLLRDGPATYAAMLAAIAAATDHIHMETYIIEDDAVGQLFSAALIAKQRQGVQVNLLHDSVGTIGTPTAFFKQLTDAGIRVLEFNPINPLLARKEWELNQRDHRKLLIIDGKIAFLGGINISSVYSSGSSTGLGSGARTRKAKARAQDAGTSWRDTDMQLQGPVVAELQKLFLAAWASQKGEPLEVRHWFPEPRSVGKDVVRAIGSSPEEPFSLIYATLLSAIGSAETSVLLTNAYFAPDPQLMAALKAAVARGVQVRLILPSQTDSQLVFHAGRSHYDELLRAGVQIYERRGRVLHSKTALIDGVWATVGSTNLDWRSFLHNYEINAVVLGREFGQQVADMFDHDLALSDPITLEQWRRRPLAPRLMEGFARLWEYWL